VDCEQSDSRSKAEEQDTRVLVHGGHGEDGYSVMRLQYC
jgi:hypothetical protein